MELAEAQARFVPREFLRSLNRASIVDVSLGDNIRKEMTVPFSDIFAHDVQGNSSSMLPPTSPTQVRRVSRGRWK